MRELLKQICVVLEKCSDLKKVNDIIINNMNQNFKNFEKLMLEHHDTGQEEETHLLVDLSDGLVFLSVHIQNVQE